MRDMLDFYGHFWENLLDNRPRLSDNSDKHIGGLTYASSDYLDNPRSRRMQMRRKKNSMPTGQYHSNKNR